VDDGEEVDPTTAGKKKKRKKKKKKKGVLAAAAGGDVDGGGSSVEAELQYSIADDPSGGEKKGVGEGRADTFSPLTADAIHRSRNFAEEALAAAFKMSDDGSKAASAQSSDCNHGRTLADNTAGHSHLDGPTSEMGESRDNRDGEWGASGNSPSACGNCGAVEDGVDVKLRLCLRCSVQKYCSRQCQKVLSWSMFFFPLEPSRYVTYASPSNLLLFSLLPPATLENS
jgi:hypothetical protein